MHNPKEASDDDYESDHAGMGLSWDLDYDSPTKLDSSKEGSIFDEIPHLERHMQKHQKEGFEFLWRNLAGLDSRRQPFWPPREPGGCVLSHAPGTGKSFLVISFLQSYMKVSAQTCPRNLVLCGEDSCKLTSFKMTYYDFMNTWQLAMRCVSTRRLHNHVSVIQHILIIFPASDVFFPFRDLLCKNFALNFL